MRLLNCSLLFVAITCSPLLFSQNSLHGIDVTDLDRKADPCNDFFQFSNGTWRANNPIPASMTRWSKRWASGEMNKDSLKEIAEHAAQGQDLTTGSTRQIVGDYYGACMDETRVNERGIAPLKPLLAEIDNAKDMSELQHAMADLHDIGVTVPFTLGGQQDPHQPTTVLADIGASGYALPDRDYYLKPDARFKDAREKYVQHMINMFKLVGFDAKSAGVAASTVIAMETKFAEAALDNVTLRDPSATDHNTKFAQLQEMVPHFDWAAYFEHKHLAKDVDLNVDQPKYMQEVERQLHQTSLPDWKIYLKWQLLNSVASSLSEPLVEEDFAFNGKYLTGSGEMKPRWKRCVESTDQYLGEALGQEYVRKYFPPAAKARMQEMVRNLLAAMRDDILSRPWMSDETKERGLAKIATFMPKIGYPDQWKDYSQVTITRDAFFEDNLAGRRFVVEDDRATIGKTVDRGRWGMTPPTSNAYYNPLLNEIVFPAGILEPPAFDMKAVDAVNYGAIGVVIGHEISHGFDDEGAQYDYLGRLKNWWKDTDLKQFQQRAACVADQFDHYFIEEGVHHNGKMVLGESIGDLGGAKIAYLAYQKSLEGKPRPADIDGFTPEQQFFLAWGQWRGDEIRIEQQRVMMQNDPHPVAKYRVNGPLSNLPEFQKAFSCQADAAMVRPPEKRCDVW
ncbi:MAG TPA: M13 family metallopeptidase [Terriglobales bacterium]|jgi:endothelin-converting enzyme/putative endopeptidase|nr:M13 family metallopeptidase [Terriglobales bacterium]